MKTGIVPSASSRSAQELPAETFEILAATLCELFQMPCDEMLRHLNAQFAANPLTADFRLDLGPARLLKLVQHAPDRSY
jgi:hypothetical protein